MNNNPYFKLLKSALPGDFDLSCSKVYIIKRFELLANYLLFFEANLEKKNFSERLKALRYNPYSNNIIVFYVQNDLIQGQVYLVSDSLCAYGNEFILKSYNYIFDKEIVEESFVEIIN